MSVDQSQHVVDETVKTSESFFDRQVEVEKEIEHKRVLQTSQDTTARLEAAVLSTPLVQGTHAEKPISVSVTPERERPKGFRLNSLISRMTGHGEAHESEVREQSPTSLHAAPAEDRVDPEMERIEIPAFLRRQAN
jgi:cell division protein FtsZ